jgi:hypothetical protein
MSRCRSMRLAPALSSAMALSRACKSYGMLLGLGRIRQEEDTELTARAGLVIHKSERYIVCMQTNFSVFRERFAEACRIRGTTETKLCAGVGIGSRSAIALYAPGPKGMDIYRLCQIADGLNVSIDWLLGRSDVMDVPQAKTARSRQSKR